MKVVIAGGAGSLGRRLADDCARRGDEVTILTRAPRDGIAHRQVTWDGRTVGPWRAELEGAIVVNFAGELVDKRPTTKNIELLRRSRVEPTRALLEAASTLTTPPSLWLQMSTLAIYGDAGQDIVDEEHPLADGPPQCRASRAHGSKQPKGREPTESSSCERGSSSITTPRPSIVSSSSPGSVSAGASARASSGSAGSTSTTSCAPCTSSALTTKSSAPCTSPRRTRSGTGT